MVVIRRQDFSSFGAQKTPPPNWQGRFSFIG